LGFWYTDCLMLAVKGCCCFSQMRL